MNVLLTFGTFADVFSCEKAVRAAGMSCRAVPVPRSLDASCDFAAEIRDLGEEDVFAVLELLKKKGLRYTRLFRSMTADSGDEVY